MTSADGMELADELRRIRREARIGSQQALADLSGVNRSTVRNIEMGKRPRADTLILVARGAATNPDGTIDESRRDRYFDRLMRAAGYQADGADDGESGEPRQMTWAEARQWLVGVTGRRDVSFAFADVFSNYRRLGPAHQQALESAALAAVEALRMREEAERDRQERQAKRDE